MMKMKMKTISFSVVTGIFFALPATAEQYSIQLADGRGETLTAPLFAQIAMNADGMGAADAVMDFQKYGVKLADVQANAFTHAIWK